MTGHGARAAMKRRSKARGKAGKAGRRMAATPKRAISSKPEPRGRLARTGRETETARLTREFGEIRAQLTATSEVLRVISNSSTDLKSALGAIAESAARLLDVAGAEISRVEGDGLRLMAKHGSFPQRPVGSMRPINRGWVTGRAVVDRTTVQVVDLLAAESEFPEGAASARQFGHRTTLATPLLREGNPIGAILIRRMEVRPFTDKQIPPRPSSPLRTLGCSTNCASHFSSRPPPPMCSRCDQSLDFRSADSARYAGEVGCPAVRSGQCESSPAGRRGLSSCCEQWFLARI